MTRPVSDKVAYEVRYPETARRVLEIIRATPPGEEVNTTKIADAMGLEPRQPERRELANFMEAQGRPARGLLVREPGKDGHRGRWLRKQPEGHSMSIQQKVWLAEVGAAITSLQQLIYASPLAE